MVRAQDTVAIDVGDADLHFGVIVFEQLLDLTESRIVVKADFPHGALGVVAVPGRSGLRCGCGFCYESTSCRRHMFSSFVQT